MLTGLSCSVTLTSSDDEGTLMRHPYAAIDVPSVNPAVMSMVATPVLGLTAVIVA